MAKKLIQITLAVDEDTGAVDQVGLVQVGSLPQSGIDQFKKRYEDFGDAVTKEAAAAGVKPEHIKKHPHKK